MSEFIGAIGDRAFLIEAIRAAFKGKTFDICLIHSLPQFSYKTFAKWAHDCHCEDISPELRRRLQFYVVNYLLCPETTDALEVEAVVNEVFAIPDSAYRKEKTVFKIGKYKVVKNA